MLLINGAVRYLILFLVFALMFYFDGGHILQLTDPMLIGIQLVIFGVAMAFYMKTLRPETEPEILQTRFAGRAGFVLSLLIPMVLGLVEFARHGYRLDSLGALISIVVLSILHGAFIYYSFFHWVYGPQAFEGIATAQRFLQFRSERRIWRALYVGCSFLFCGAGILMFVGFVGLAFGAAIGELFQSKQDKLVKQLEHESYETINKKIDEVEAKYAADNCKLMPDTEMYKAKDELREKQHKIDEEKIYKIYHPD